jgi:hypothetical protein
LAAEIEASAGETGGRYHVAAAIDKLGDSGRQSGQTGRTVP